VHRDIHTSRGANPLRQRALQRRGPARRGPGSGPGAERLHRPGGGRTQELQVVRNRTSAPTSDPGGLRQRFPTIRIEAGAQRCDVALEAKP
jgi:hypothetical protein